MEEQDKKSKKRAIVLTGIIQLLLIAVVYLMVVWRAPDPPNPEYGIELSFASMASSTSPSPRSAASSSTPVKKAVPSEDLAEEVVKGNLPDKVNTEVNDQEPSAPDNAALLSEEPVKQPTNEIEEVIKENEPMEEAYPEANQGEAEGEVEEPTVDERALYGNQGTGELKNSSATDGANLSLAGWVWDFKPDPKDTSDESGKIVYDIVVDAEGYLVKIETRMSTVSPLVERKYRQAVEKLTFSKTAEYRSAPLSKGTITFIIKTR